MRGTEDWLAAKRRKNIMLPKPYYERDGITLYCGEMEGIVPHLDRVDEVVTDPPYNETSLEWDVWPKGWPSLVRGLSDSLWCFGSMKMFWKYRDDFAGWELAQDVVWEKHNGSGMHNDRFRRVHEYAIELVHGQALQFYQGAWAEVYKAPPVISHPDERKVGSLIRKSKPKHYGGVSNGKYSYGGTRLERSVLRVRSCHGYAVNETQKPEGIVEPLLRYSVPPGGVVLDCFGGSGTTAVVARQQGKRAILIEKRESQCEEIVARLRGTLAL